MISYHYLWLFELIIRLVYLIWMEIDRGLIEFGNDINYVLATAWSLSLINWTHYLDA